MPIKTRMKEYRVRLNMSQEDLANKVGSEEKQLGSSKMKNITLHLNLLMILRMF